MIDRDSYGKGPMVRRILLPNYCEHAQLMRYLCVVLRYNNIITLLSFLSTLHQLNCIRIINEMFGFGYGKRVYIMQRKSTRVCQCQTRHA